MERAIGRRWTDPILLWTFRRFPPSDLIFKDLGRRPGAEYRSEVAQPLATWFGLPDDFMAGKDLLDLGCGYGGRPVRFSELGAHSVSGVEIDDPLVEAAHAFAASEGVALDVRVGSGESIPFPDESFDLVTMYDVMEHVISPREVLAECYRVLRSGGQLALVFPPYYQLFGGSHLHGYATSVPGLNLIFSTGALRSATEKHLDEQGWSWRDYLRDEPTDKLWNQNGLTVRGFHRLVGRSAFQVRLIRHVGLLDRRLSPNARHRRASIPLFAACEQLARVPVMCEALCLRVVGLLDKA
jgi:SAM-dependent methyltransferase